MDTALPQKFPCILDRNLAKGNRVCTSCDLVVLAFVIFKISTEMPYVFISHFQKQEMVLKIILF